MTSLEAAKKYMIDLTRATAKQYLPPHVEVDVNFDRDIKAESDGYMRPIYLPDGRVKFKITYNLDLLEANLKNIYGNAVKGLVLHELAHAYDFLNNEKGFLKNPHKNRTFTTIMAKMMGTSRGSPVYRAAMQPDVSTQCALKRCKNKISPAWLSTYYLYFCKKCQYFNAYVVDLRAKLPICENCGAAHNSLITAKIPPTIAAKMDVQVTQHPKNYDSDREMRNFILKSFDKYITPTQRKELTKYLTPAQKKELHIPNKKLVKK